MSSTNPNDELALRLIAEVDRREKEIQQIEKSSWQTNCQFSYVENGASGIVTVPIHLRVEERLDVLTKIAAFVTGKARDYKAAQAELDVNIEFTWMGYTEDQWLADIKTRISRLRIAEKKATLQKYRAQLDGVLTSEMRTSLILQKLEKELT